MLEVACIIDKIREARLRWYGHVMRTADESSIKRIVTAEVNGRRCRGRQKKRWGDKIGLQLDMKSPIKEIKSKEVERKDLSG